LNTRSSYSKVITEVATEIPRSRSISIQSERVLRRFFFALTWPARLIAPPNSRSFSVSVVLPEGFGLFAARDQGGDASTRGTRRFLRCGPEIRVPFTDSGPCCYRLFTVSNSIVPSLSWPGLSRPSMS
jgi:hypothetical protein